MRELEIFTTWSYLGAWKIVRKLPEKLAYSIFRYGARFLDPKKRKGAARLRANLLRVKTELDEEEFELLFDASARSYMRYWCDTFRFPDWSKARILTTTKVTNEDKLLEALASGKGAVVALPHAGNWDHAGAYFCAKGIPLVTVAEHLKPERVFQEFLTYRQKIGMEVLDLDSRAIVTLIARLREGAMVALVADRDLSQSGVDVSFFGGKARMPAGPAILSIKTGARLFTAMVSYTPSGILIDFLEVIIPSEGTIEDRVNKTVQLCADNFAQGISEHPEDWHMLQKIWIDSESIDAH